MPTFYDWVQPSENINSGAYIDTGIEVPQTADTLVSIILKFDNLGKNSLKLFGTSLSTGDESEGCIKTYTPTTAKFNHASGTYLGNLDSSKIPHEIAVSYKIGSSDMPTIEVDGAVTTWKPFGGISTLGEGNYMLFGHYVSAWGRIGVDQSKCYGLQILLGGELVFDGKPAMDENGAGMYDFVKRKMFYNAATRSSLEVGND